MKKDEVPQDRTGYYGGARKAVYAVDERGELAPVASSGWQAEEIVTGAAADEYARLAQDALARAREGRTSPLEFHMFDRRMDVPMLAETSGIWRWRIRRHFRPEIFARLDDALLRRYADALGIGVARLKSLP